METLHELLDDDPREKVIVFTEYLDTLNFLQERLEQEASFRGRITRLTGGMSMNRRQQMIDEFSSAARILLATDAASEGLNLQDHCHLMIHVELPWNPNRLEQRIGRIHRWGQKKECRIFNLYLPQSPESRVLQINLEKLERMRRDLGAINDVLGALGEQEVAVRVGRFSAAWDENEVKSAAGELAREYDAAADAARKDPEGLGRHQAFTAEDCRRWQPVLEAARREAPSPEDLRLLVESDPVRGQLQPVKGRQGAFRLRVMTAPFHRLHQPDRLVTFDQNLAAKRENQDADLLSPSHPLVAAAIRHHRARLFQPDDRPFRVTTRVSSDAQEAGILYLFRGVLRDQVGMVEERLEPVWTPLGGPVSSDPATDEAVMRARELPVNVNQQRVCDALQSHHEASIGAAEAEARRRLDARLASLKQRRHELQLELLDRVEQWAELATGQAQAAGGGAGQQLALFTDPTRVEAEQRTLQQRIAEIERLRDEEVERINLLNKVSLDDELIPLAALVVIPEREADRWR